MKEEKRYFIINSDRDISGPFTLKELQDEICDELGWQSQETIQECYTVIDCIQKKEKSIVIEKKVKLV